MSNTVLIKEVNNVPVIFNVDNAVDAARLEALQAVKMAEDLVSSVFGEQSNFADNTTCIVTDNPNNAEFPFNVVFNSSKIPAKPKRNTAMFANLPMPSDKYIDIATVDKKPFLYTPPANGYIVLHQGNSENSEFKAHVSIQSYKSIDDIDDNKFEKCIMSSSDTLEAAYNITSIFIPVRKGQVVEIYTWYIGTTTKRELKCRFIYAEGEI